ncbi:unnamed protein product [Mytilus coruscus]|uniref:Uncharacterized protein n=1 Tax=Mytilus coruscus TaxID=42192 RepID=A0A6J8A1K9_MYTCO|nr:unnamed protein product [Mytilus coruscus]
MILEDACGKSMYAVEVFAFSIKALKTHLEEHLERNNIYTNPERTKWILTVPAIWSDAAKQFMRKSGEMAGIPNSKLHIALESEVASVYCQCFPPVGGVDIAAIGSKYIVADLGGGTTVDITAHETLPNQKLKELTKASGNNCGGNMIENHFIEVIFGSEFLSVFRKRYPDSFIYLLRWFESMKRIVQSSKSAFVTVTIPYTILNSFCISERGVGLHEFISSKFNSEIAKVFKDKIRIHLDYAKDQFEKICKEIVLLINELFRRDEFNNFRHILLVGGFAKCRLVHECLQNAFPQLSVIVPEDPDLAVLKGSVLFGYKPDIISYRIIRYSYGVLSTPLFDEKVHDSKRKIVCVGHARCNNVFKSFMEAGTLVRRNTVIKRSYRTRQRFQENLWIQVFYAERGNVQYTDGDHCQKLGEIVVHLLKPSEQGQLVDVVFHFGETELTVEAGDPESNTRYSVLLKIHEFKQ